MAKKQQRRRQLELLQRQVRLARDLKDADREKEYLRLGQHMGFPKEQLRKG